MRFWRHIPVWGTDWNVSYLLILTSFLTLWQVHFMRELAMSELWTNCHFENDFFSELIYWMVWMIHSWIWLLSSTHWLSDSVAAVNSSLGSVLYPKLSYDQRNFIHIVQTHNSKFCSIKKSVWSDIRVSWQKNYIRVTCPFKCTVF